VIVTRDSLSRQPLSLAGVSFLTRWVFLVAWPALPTLVCLPDSFDHAPVGLSPDVAGRTNKPSAPLALVCMCVCAVRGGVSFRRGTRWAKRRPLPEPARSCSWRRRRQPGAKRRARQPQRTLGPACAARVLLAAARPCSLRRCWHAGRAVRWGGGGAPGDARAFAAHGVCQGPACFFARPWHTTCRRPHLALRLGLAFSAAVVRFAFRERRSGSSRVLCGERASASSAVAPGEHRSGSGRVLCGERASSSSAVAPGEHRSGSSRVLCGERAYVG